MKIIVKLLWLLLIAVVIFVVAMALIVYAAREELANIYQESQDDSLLVLDSPVPKLSYNQFNPLVSAVSLQPRYQVNVSTREYAKGLVHEFWNSQQRRRKSLRLDIYQPVIDNQNKPALVLFHGGGFAYGSKKDENLAGIARFFASRGWTVFSVEYRLLKHRGTLPQAWIDTEDGDYMYNGDRAHAIYPAIRDAKAAVRWIKANADEYGVNPSFITALGPSAGGMIAIALGVSDERDFKDELAETTDPTLSSTNMDQDSNVDLVVNYWGSPVALDILQHIDGEDRFDAVDSDILIIHGENDGIVLYQEALRIRSKYIENGNYFYMYTLLGQPHGPWAAKIEGRSFNQVTFDFIVRKQNLAVITANY